MRAVLTLEFIGWDLWSYQQAQKRGFTPQCEARYERAFLRGGVAHFPRPWVARITGCDERHGLARTFVDGQIDFTHANSTGSRGIMLYFALAPGVYEVYARVSWTRSRRYFCQAHEDTSITEITREEVEQWLARPAANASAVSESTS
jgi:hypothetical protein